MQKVFLLLASMICLHGCTELMYRYCMYEHYAPEAISAGDLEVNGSRLLYKAKRIPIPYQYELHPQIPRLTVSMEADSEYSSDARIVFTLDENHFETIDAVLNKLRERQPPISRTGLWYSTLNSCPQEMAIEVSQILEDYCLRNDIDLFIGHERELYSDFAGRFITWWHIRSSKTIYGLPEEFEANRKPKKRSRVA